MTIWADMDMVGVADKTRRERRAARSGRGVRETQLIDVIDARTQGTVNEVELAKVQLNHKGRRCLVSIEQLSA